MPWWKVGCLTMVVLAGVAFLALNELVGNAGGDVSIDGMKCGAEMANYHVHAHLALFDAGRSIPLSTGIGRSGTGSCWYWLHTHDGSGVVHVEGPDRSFNLTLGMFFDVWHQPLSRQGFLAYRMKANQSMRAYVNGQLYRGSLQSIALRRHTTITLEIGPPFAPPTTYNFGGL